MADHLRLSDPTPLATRRRPPGPQGRGPIDRPGHASTIAGVLAGLGLPYPTAQGVVTDEVERDEEDSRLVLVFTDIGALREGPFRKWHMTPVAEGGDQTYMVISDTESRRVFAELVGAYGGDADAWSDPKAWQEQLDSIGGVRVYGPEDRADPRLSSLDPEVAEVVDVLIWPSTFETQRLRADTARTRVEEIRGVVARHAERNRNLRIVAEDPRPDSTLLRVVADGDLRSELLGHVLVERIRPPLRPEVSNGTLVLAEAPAVAPEASGEPIGIIDDLVMDNPLLAGVVRSRTASPASHVFGPGTPHGTHIAGVAAYGDLRQFAIAGEDELPEARPIHSVRIMDADPTTSTRARVVGLFHEQIEHALRTLHAEGVKIVTCSINDDVADSAPTPSETMTVIDQLARELGLVVVVSAGNVRDVDPHHWRDGYPAYLDRPEARIADPAGAALAITVGARAHFDVPAQPAYGPSTSLAIAQAGQPSPFTRTGPSRGRGSTGRSKPEFAAPGGNYSWDSLTGGPRGKDPAMSVVTTAPPGLTGGRILAVDDGTSLAAPYVANQIAAIATRYPDAGSNLLRALTALAGDRHEVDREGGAIVSAYGEPVAARVLESGTHQTVIHYEGTIRPNSIVIHHLPIPPEFATGRFAQRIRIALAFDPPVRRSRRDYLAGGMAFDFVRNMSFDEVAARYSRQPNSAEMADDPSQVALDLPSGAQRPSLRPAAGELPSSTLIRRSFTGSWDPDDEGYYLVVSHRARHWARGDELEDQPYAVAVMLSLAGEARIDLRAQVEARLEVRSRARAARR